MDHLLVERKTLEGLNCEKSIRQVRRATSYQDLPSMGQDGYQGRVSGPYNVSDALC